MIGELFGKAWELYKRDVWWLILAGLIVVGIFAAAAAVVIAVLLAVLRTGAGGVTTGTAGLSSLLGAAIVAYVVGVTLASIVGLVFSGGLYEMVIGAERESRQARLADLFGGFRRFGSYALLWLCQIGVVLGVELVVFLSLRFAGPLGLLVGLVGIGVIVWVMVSWVYGIVLVTDRQMGAVEALRESTRMVRTVGWWSTFGALVLLGLAFVVGAWILTFIAGQAQGLGLTLLVVFYIFAFPFSICYVAAMYLGSSWAPATGTGHPFGVPEPPAPPAPDGFRAASSPAASADAWRAAADPLAAPVVQSLHASAAPPAPPAPEPDAPARGG